MKVMFRQVVGDHKIEAEIEGRVDHVASTLAAFGHVAHQTPRMNLGGQEEGYRIVGKDNLASETVSDVLWLDGFSERALAQRVCDKLNEGLGDGPGRYYVVLAPGENMYVWKP